MTKLDQFAALQSVADAVTDEKPDAPKYQLYENMSGAAVLWFSGCNVRVRLHPENNEQAYAYAIYITTGTTEFYLYSGIQKPAQVARLVAPILAQQMLPEPKQFL